LNEDFVGLDAGDLAGWHCQRTSDVTATRLAAFRLHLPEVFKNLIEARSIAIIDLKICNGALCEMR